MQILIIDENAIPFVMAQSLKKQGYDVISVGNTNLAIEIILREQIQFVITDSIIPEGCSGSVLCQRLRELDLPFYTYIILVTSPDGLQSEVQGIDSDPDDFILKPIQYHELYARIKAGEQELRSQKNLQRVNEAHRHDIKMAATMQRSLLPDASSSIQSITIDWLFFPSTDMSGDIFNFFSLDEHHVGFYIIDVAGHGIASAIKSSVLTRMLSPYMGSRNLLKLSLPVAPFYQLRTTSEVVAILNEEFQTDDFDILYFTMVYGVIDTLAHTIDFCQAGHPHPLYLTHERTAQFIGDGGFPVGISAQAEYTPIHLVYCSDDRLFLYSDGITECESPDGIPFGAERLRMFVDETRHLRINEVVYQLKERICSWCQRDFFEDDISMLVLEMKFAQGKG